MKFKVGDKVRYLNSNMKVVKVFPQAARPYVIQSLDESHEFYCFEDNLELIQPEVQNPIPGKFYRTRCGDKLRFLIKGIKEYVYEDEDGIILSYVTPIKYSEYSPDREMLNDIVGEWTDEIVLPVVEVKRWAIVLTIDSVGHKRGEVMTTCADKQFLEDSFKQDLKLGVVALIELTGTLPERKI